MKQLQDMAIDQAHKEVTRALLNLERATGRVVTGVRIHEGSTVGGLTQRAIEIELAPQPAVGWMGA